MSAPTPHPHAELQIEHKRQEVMGELAAGWWEWEWSDRPNPKFWGRADRPLFHKNDFYRCIKTPNHPQYDRQAAIREKWVKLAGKGTHELWARPVQRFGGFEKVDVIGLFSPEYEYEIREIKPKKRLIDWSKVPRGVMTNCGEFLGIGKDCVNAQILQRDAANWHEMLHVHPLTLRLDPADQQPWILGDKQLACVGLQIESCGLLPPQDAWAFRVTGLAEGYTDNASEAE
jgi:hypothetical protein